MEEDNRIAGECVVSGVLGVTLQVARIIGIAPLKFERVRGGWCIRVSQLYRLHGYISVLCCFVLLMVYMYNNGDLIDDEMGSWAPENYVNEIMTQSVTYVFLATSIVVVHTSYYRMCHLIDCIAQLTEINKHIYQYNDARSQDGTLWIVLVASLIFGLFANIFDYVVYLCDLVDAGPVNFTIAVAYLFFVVLHFYVIQFAIVLLMIVASFKRLNYCLSIIVQKTQNDSSSHQAHMTTGYYRRNTINRHVESTIETANSTDNLMSSIIYEGGLSNAIKEFACLYCALCEVVRHLMKTNGVNLIMVLWFSFMFMTSTPYYTFNVLFTVGSRIPAPKAVGTLVFFAFATLVIATAVEPCHRLHQQLKLTKRLVYETLRLTRHDAVDLRHELKIFKRHIFLNPISFRPLELLTFNRLLITAVLSIVVTNLSLIMHL